MYSALISYDISFSWKIVGDVPSREIERGTTANFSREYFQTVIPRRSNILLWKFTRLVVCAPPFLLQLQQNGLTIHSIVSK